MKRVQKVLFGKFKFASIAGAFVLPIITAITSCGSPTSTSRMGSGDGNGLRGRDKIMTPPKEYYDSLMSERMQLASTGALATAKEQVLWINFNGATVQQGYTRGTSFLPCKDSVSIPASGIGAADQQIILNKVAEFYSNAGTKVSITFDQPASGDFTTIHVGGNYGTLGCAGGSAVAGIAPFDVSNANPNDIGFVFTNTRDVEALAETIAHESGHSFGLDHTDNKSDIMYPVTSSSVTGFGKGIADGSGTEQDGPALLQAALGTGSASVSGKPVSPTAPVPMVVVPTKPGTQPFPNLPGFLPTLPGLGALGGLNNVLTMFPTSLMGALNCVLPGVSSTSLPGGIPLPNAQGALGLLTVLQSAVLGQNGGQFNMIQLMGLVGGLPTMNITQLISMAGIAVSASNCLSQLVPVNIPGITNVLQGQMPTGINVAQIMGIANITNPGQLIALLPQFSQVIGANVQGANAQTLMSLVMMGMGQQYQNIVKIPVAP